MQAQIKLEVLTGKFSIVKLAPSASVPNTIYKSSFFSISKTTEELSILCESELAPESDHVENNWAVIKVLGPLDFSLTGILSSIASPLASEKISIFAISTFDTDYILVKEDNVTPAINCLEKAGFQFCKP